MAQVGKIVAEWGAKSRLVEKLCDNLKPNFLLSDDGNLQGYKVSIQTFFEKIQTHFLVKNRPFTDPKIHEIQTFFGITRCFDSHRSTFGG